MSDKNTSGPSDSTVFLFISVLLLGVFAKNIDHLQKWAENHWFMLALAGGGLIYGISWFMKWKFRMNHPEVYEREMAVKQMQNRNRRDHDGN